MTRRDQIAKVIEPGLRSTVNAYDTTMLVAIVASLAPLAFKESNVAFSAMEACATILFTVDYLLRWMTADLRTRRTGFAAFLSYPITPMAIVDLLSLLPGYTAVNQGFRLFRAVRLGRILRMFRLFKAARYSRSVSIIVNVLRRQRDSLVAVSAIAVAYVLVASLVIFNVEPDSFDTYFDAVYWATVSLTTVGYGDIYPVTTAGRIVTMVSAVFGIAVVALPAGIITAGLLEELNKDDEGA